MASPIELFVVPNIGLELEFFGDGFKSAATTKGQYYSQGKRDTKELLHYKVKSNDIPLFKGATAMTFTGGCAPLSGVTLPSAVRRMAGIPSTACHYTYIHPPTNLAREINWAMFHRKTVNKDDDLTLVENKWAIPLIAKLGGYVYLDKNLKIISVNALSLLNTSYDLRLSGPFNTQEIATKDIRTANRAHPLTMEYFHEVGFVASAWIRPGEKFRGHLASTQHHYNHGCFMFFRDDGSSVIYSIDPSGYVDPGGEASSLADAFNSSSTVKSYVRKNTGFVTNYRFSNEEELNQTRMAIANVKCSRQKSDFLSSIGDQRTLIHHACKAECNVTTIIQLLNEDEVTNLVYQDEFGFIPLHYACRHAPKNVELISFLIGQSPDSVFIRDNFDRCALHIACDSNASLQVIVAIMGADPLRNALHQKTKLLGRLPIHIACYKKLSVEAIHYLVNADVGSVALTKKTKAGRLPLHMAIEQKLPTDVIKLLLREDLGSSFHPHDAIEISYTQAGISNGKHAITTPFNGVIPLQIACWNNSSPETIKALLDADEANITVHMEVGQESPILQRPDCLNDEERESSILLQASYSMSNSYSMSKDEEEPRLLVTKNVSGRAPDEVRCSLPLHLAAMHGSAKVISLLLEKENANTTNEGVNNIMFQDHLGRTPLHIVLRNSTDPSIISSLLDFDKNGETTQIKDDYGFMPIHYACERKDASEEIVKLLIEAENRYIAFKTNHNEDHKMKRSTHMCEARQKSPLYLAVKAGAPESVIEKLLEPDQFFLKGFDSELVAGLSSMAVKNRVIQCHIIEKLSERCYFNLLFTDIYANACALALFLAASENLVAGEITALKPLMIWACMVVFVLRELIQIKSQGIQFFADVWNWCQIALTTLLGLSARHMMDEAGNPNPDINKRLLTVSGALLIAQFTFFLRSTFLPFARFVGGLTMIFATLVPFFIVSSLLLLAFAYGFFIQGTNDACVNLTACYAWTLQGFFSGSDDTDDILDVLFGIIAIVVLLNVVIAIVSEAWDTAQVRALNLFWKFRLEFLSEARFFAYLDKRLCHGGCFEKLGERIDGLRDIKFVDHVSWSNAPYNVVSIKKQYDKPFEYFGPELAQKIFESKSLQADLYWTRMESKKKKRRVAKRRILYATAFFKWLVYATFYGMLCLLGLVTAGWLWPRNLRMKVLAVGLGSQKEVEVKMKADEVEDE